MQTNKNSAPDFAAWQKRARAQTELVLSRLLPESVTQPERLHEAMRYVTLDGGKRLRPLLVLAAAELGTPDETALAHAMAAVECIHVYSLVHDDMPEMDNDSLRRGRATCHVQYDQATALLTGDALQTLAFDLLSRPTELPAQRQLCMVQTLARASGSLGMAGGQAIDLSHVGQKMTQQELAHMHSLKTGALIRAATALGALACADLDDGVLAALDVYAGKLGLAFQVMDDVLDCVQDTATLGKTAGKDAAEDKPTYVQLLGVEAARNLAQSLVDEARATLNGFAAERAYSLHALAQFVTNRQY